MEQTKKHLKVSSYVVLIFAALSLIRIGAELIFGEINSAAIPADAPENILLITKIILLVVALLLTIPKIYVGLKGLRIAKNPNTSKGHIVWAVIIFVVLILGLIDPIGAIIKYGNWGDNLSALLNILLEVLIYYDFIKYARETAKLAK